MMSIGATIGVIAGAFVVFVLLPALGVGLAIMYRNGHSRPSDFETAPVGVGFLRCLSSRLVDTDSTRSIHVGLDVLDVHGALRTGVHKEWMGPREHADYVALAVGTMMPVRRRADGSAIVSPRDLGEAQRIWREEQRRAELVSPAQAAALDRGTPARATVERIVETDARWHEVLVGFDVHLAVFLTDGTGGSGGAEYAAVSRVFAPREAGFAQLRAGERIDVRISAEDRGVLVIVNPPVSAFWTPEYGKIAS